MTTTLNTNLTQAIQTAATQANLQLISTTEGKDFHGHPTAVFELAPAGGASTQALAGPHPQARVERALRFQRSEQARIVTGHDSASR